MRNAKQAATLMATLYGLLAGSGFIWPRSLRPRGEVTRNTGPRGEVTRNTGPRMITASDHDIKEWNRNVKSRQVLRRLGEHSSQRKWLSVPTKG